ncbi:hypothetical protein ACFY41_23315 [Streptomyces syringium]|uniref:hypothetical protein n=1 Tax=Streptomyces syringium TaxID=76729 RepID=UPI0036963127
MSIHRGLAAAVLAVTAVFTITSATHAAEGPAVGSEAQIGTAPKEGKSLFGSIIGLQSETKVILPSIYKNYVSKVKKGIK